MRVLVTGGAGFIGSHVVETLALEGHEVVAFDDLSSGKRGNVHAKATLVVGDIRDAAAVDRVFDDLRPDAVSHQAAQVSVSVSTREPVRDAEINVLGSLNVIRAAARHRSRFVVASTGGAIYGNVAEGAASLATPPAPMSPYACSKLAVESYLRWAGAELGLASTVLRYANVYGPRQDPHGEAGVVAIFAERVLAGQGVQINARRETGDEGCVRDYVFVDDVVRANVRALRGELPIPIANVASGIPTTTLALLRAIEAAAGKTSDVKYAPRRAGDVERSLLVPSPEAVGTPTALADGIARTVTWFRERHA
ncbi:MAG: SDR family NAD(P)-dependent oxidoreductase [Sandaracinus sp.]